MTDPSEKRDLLKATYCRIGSCDEVRRKRVKDGEGEELQYTERGEGGRILA